MKLKELLLELVKYDGNLEVILHDNHATYEIVEIRNDQVNGVKCIGIVTDTKR